MKYILVIDHILTGGAERILIDYYHHLENNGHSPHIFCLTGTRDQSAWTKGLNITYGESRDEDNIVKKTIQQINLYIKLQRLVNSIHPDVIFSFLEKSNLLTGLVRTKSVKKIMTVHNVLSIQYTKIKNPWIMRMTYSMIRNTYNRCSRVIAVSQQVKDDLVKSYGVKSANIAIVNNYVDKADISMKCSETIDDFIFESDKHYIMNIGRFSDQKAQWKLLKAFSVYLKRTKDNVNLVLIGDGDNKDMLVQLAKELRIDSHTHFLPFNVNPYKYMSHANLFVLSSIFEGFPIVLAEISSLRIPFVGSRRAVPQEMFSNQVTWENSTYSTTYPDKDFSTNIHDDEYALAELFSKGIEDRHFTTKLLEATAAWESSNSKLSQFEMYDII